MQLNPARGRKRDRQPADAHKVESGFMQLNPARGRKPVFSLHDRCAA